MLAVGAVWSAVLLTRVLVVVTAAAVIVGIAGEVADQRVDGHQGDETLLHRLDARRFELTRGPLSRILDRLLCAARFNDHRPGVEVVVKLPFSHPSVRSEVLEKVPNGRLHLEAVRLILVLLNLAGNLRHLPLFAEVD